MNESQRTLDLLNEAHETLTKAVIPSVSKQDRYSCLMIANALRIVERHFRTLTQDESIGGATDISLGGGALVKEIRTGLFDTHSPLRGSLVRQLRDRLSSQLAIDNPRVLEQLTQSST
ncbi:hypothetical protein R69746_06012 [Paraburkholderia aspalathi]|uniref:DUF6285 domain-containing protein n=1 Tax=Paraburkholderia aspalathi TaxID=1324617 RepID=UPI00190CD0C9|nr:DUF6285 domain-containing protein [Paraburkholderia aspalathi]MBK3842077.1 hypothetical protein [Paraburkholderia aspalathi]CAE6820036.1 hypothetical protein R69746_06012 [Paraburkholderia aspalathi]